MEESMLTLSKFSQNYHSSGVKLLAKNIRRGIRIKEFFIRISLCFNFRNMCSLTLHIIEI
jgi:hypothetical protein